MNEDIGYENRIVAFLDILGFKKIIEESQRNNSKLKAIYEVLNFLKKREQPDSWKINLVEVEEEYQKRYNDEYDISDRINCTCFSDSIVVSIEIVDDNIHQTMSTLVCNLACIGANLILRDILFRGAIAVGKLIHDNNGLVMGPALVDAYMLEEKISIYPRIILANKLIEKLNYPAWQIDDIYHQYIKRFSDGCVGFHQMSFFQVHQTTNGIGEQVEEHLKKVKEFIVKGLDSSFELPSVFLKYKWLKDEYNKLHIINEFPICEVESLGEQNIHYSCL